MGSEANRLVQGCDGVFGMSRGCSAVGHYPALGKCRRTWPAIARACAEDTESRNGRRQSERAHLLLAPQ
jgi:hypothetical protein